MLLALLLVVVACAAAMTSGEARAELQLPRRYSEKDLKSAYRKRSSYSSTIDFTGANLASADLSGAKLRASTSYGELSSILFSEANLANADLSNAQLKATNNGEAGGALIDFTNADLTNADLVEADFETLGSYGERVINFTDAILADADFSGATFQAGEGDGEKLIGLCVDTHPKNECQVSKCAKNFHKKHCKKTCSLC